MTNCAEELKVIQIVEAYNALPKKAQEYIYPLFKAIAEGRATKEDLLAELENRILIDQKEVTA